MCEALTFVKKDISTAQIHIHTQAYISYLQNTRHIKIFLENIKSIAQKSKQTLCNFMSLPVFFIELNHC